MRLLLDTRVWLWLQASPHQLSDDTVEVLRDTGNELLLSAASAWEIAIKYALGKLPLPQPPAAYVPDRMASSGVLALPIEQRHALHVATLPPLHRDPFDRLLVAQAQLESLSVVTADPGIARYDVPVVAAR